MAKRKASPSRPAAAASTPPGPALPAWLARRRLVAVLLFGLSIVLYANTFGHGYSLDDAIVITDNIFTREGPAGWGGIFGKDSFYGFFQDDSKATLVSGGRYRPLTLAMFALEYQLAGGKPFLLHLLNVAWYGLTVVALYYCALQLFGGKRYRSLAPLLALLTAVLFAVHPLHTEAVANIKGRDEIISLLGSLAALYFSLRAYRERRPTLGWLAGGLFLLGLLSKENAITFLAVIPLALLCFTRADVGAIIRRLLPVGLAALAFLALRGAVVGLSLGDPNPELMNNPFLVWTGATYTPMPVAERLATIVYTLGKYLQLLFVPYPLTHDYYPRHVPIMNWADWQVWLSLLAYVALIGFAIRGLRRRDPLGFAVGFYLITLSIVSNLVFPVGTNMSERFLFMPSVGWALAVAILLIRLGRRWQPPRWSVSLGGLLIIALPFAVLTVLRNPAWQDNFTLFSTDIHVSANSAKLRNALGGELSTRFANGTSTDTADVREAVGHLQEATRIHPRYKNAYLLLGNAYYYLQQYEAAISQYRRALEIDPGYADALNNLPVALRDAGKYYGEQRNDLATAQRLLLEAYALNPADFETNRLLGVSYGLGGQPMEAIKYFTRATEIQPNNAEAWLNLGTAYYNAGQPQRAEEYFARARAIDPAVGGG